jgi:hypothetical protein
MGIPRLQSEKRRGALLRHLTTYSPNAWLCVGDFNEILADSEKYGGARKPRGQMEAFKNTLEYCQLSDLGFSGPKFTWCNHRDGAHFTKERLDRATANNGWCDLIPRFSCWDFGGKKVRPCSSFLSFSTSGDSCPKKKRLFRYEACWDRKKEVKEVIKKVWKVKSRKDDVWEILKEKIQKCQQALISWKGAQIQVRQRSLLLKKQNYWRNCKMVMVSWIGKYS